MHGPVDTAALLALLVTVVLIVGVTGILQIILWIWDDHKRNHEVKK